MIEITVDRERCQGAGLCLFHAPLTFDQDDDCRVVLLSGRDEADAIRTAAEACPQRAITVTEIEG